MVGAVAGDRELRPQAERLVRGLSSTTKRTVPSGPSWVGTTTGRVRLSRRSVRRASDAQAHAASVRVEGRQQLVPEDIEDLLHVVHPGGGRDDEVRLGTTTQNWPWAPSPRNPCRANQYWYPPLPPVDGAVGVVVVVDVLPGGQGDPALREDALLFHRPSCSSSCPNRATDSVCRWSPVNPRATPCSSVSHRAAVMPSGSSSRGRR